jgi:hypothetical protein
MAAMVVYFEPTSSFLSDLGSLERNHVVHFKIAMKAMLDACASFNPPPSDDPQLAVNPPWPQLLAVEEIKGAFGGLYAMRWELRSNGRDVSVDDQPPRRALDQISPHRLRLYIRHGSRWLDNPAVDLGL